MIYWHYTKTKGAYITMKKTVKNIALTAVTIAMAWCLAAATDYERALALKPPTFAVSKQLLGDGSGIYHCVGYDVAAKTKKFNGGQNIISDMTFMMFGRGKIRNRSLADNTLHNYLLLGEDKETVLRYLNTLSLVTPYTDGNCETYTEYTNSGITESLTLRNGIVCAVGYECDDIGAAYDYADRLRKELDGSGCETAESTEPPKEASKHFDDIKSAADIKTPCTYYADLTPGSNGKLAENIVKISDGKDTAHPGIRMELTAESDGGASVTLKYVPLQ